MIYAAIDIGSNAVRMLVANVVVKNNKPWVDKQTMVRAPIRLGEDVYSHDVISKEKKEKLIKAIKAYKDIIELHNPVETSIFATAAMRDAKNGHEIIREIKNVVPWDVQIIDGKEEAEILLDLFRHGGKESDVKLLIDLGGGSTEMTILYPNGIVYSKSFKIGSVRMLQGKNIEKHWEKLEKFIDEYLPQGNIHCIASGGTINSLKSHFSDPIDKFITLNRIKMACNALKPLSLEQRVNDYMLRPDRADVIVPAAEIFIRIMGKAGIDHVYVPKVGLIEGMILRMYKKSVTVYSPRLKKN